MSEKKDADELAEAIIRIDGLRVPTHQHTIADLMNPQFRISPESISAISSPQANDKNGSKRAGTKSSTPDVDVKNVMANSRQMRDSTLGTRPAKVSVSVVEALAPSLRTLGDNQKTILTDVRTGFDQTYTNQQKIYDTLGEGFNKTYENQQQIRSKLKAQEQMLAKVAAGVAGLTAVTYTIQQEINTLVILFGAAFLVLVAVLGFLVWKQMQMEKRMAYLLMRR